MNKPVEPDELAWGALSSSVGPRARLLRNVLRMRASAVTEDHGLPAGSLTVLSLISANEGCSQSALADRSGFFTTNLVSIVSDLENRGLVQRVRSKEDRRYKTLALSAQGHELMATLHARIANIEDAICEAFDEREMAQFIEFLDRAIAALTEGRAAGA
jgi:DNA-binding MarR family transcriptional regulator